jgi:hypothetical protein
MNRRPDSDETRPALINQRIGQGFAFLRDVLINPSLVEKIPSGATLRHRDVALDQAHIDVHLTAYQAPAMASWTALVTGVDGSTPPVLRRSWPLNHWGWKHVTLDAAGETVVAALDSLEAKLRNTTTEDQRSFRDR